jgi:hypothetical protein
MCVIAPSAANAAVNTSNGCKANVTGAAEMGMYPTFPGQQSYLRVACIFQHASGGGGDFVSSNFTIHDFTNVLWHNGAARTAINATSTGPTASTITFQNNSGDPGCATMAGFVNRPIVKVTAGFNNVKPYTTIKSMSGCTATLNRTTGGGTCAANACTYKIENSHVRSVDDAIVNNASPDITSTEANFQSAGAASDAGCTVSGTNFADGGGALGTISVLSTTTADASPVPVAYGSYPLPSAAIEVTFCGNEVHSTTRRTLDSAATSTTTTIKSGKVKWSNDDIGMPVYGPGITSTPTNPCTIVSFTAAPGNTATLSSACGSVGITDFTIGDPTYTAPANGDAFLTLANELPLDPGLVAGSHDCSEDQASGFGITGTWVNPGSYSPPDGLFLNDQPPGTKTIAQILFKTSVIQFAGYVVEASANQDATSSGALHYDVEFPGAPTTVALCGSTATSPGLGLSIGVTATTPSQGTLVTGAGRPGTSQVRATNGGVFPPAGTTVYITDDLTNGTTAQGAGVKWLNSNSNFFRLCQVPAGKPDISPPNGFACGDG